MIKVVIFDADGMVIVPRRFSEEIQKDFGIATERLTPFFDSAFKKCLIGQADLKEEIEKCHRGWGWQGSVQELLDYWFKVCGSVDERMVRCVEDLKSRGIRCYVGTNQEKYRTQYLKNEMGFRDIFDGICSSADLGVRKPDREFFEKTLAVLNAKQPVSGSEVMFWDDRPVNVEAAREFGFEAHLFEGCGDFVTDMKV